MTPDSNNLLVVAIPLMGDTLPKSSWILVSSLSVLSVDTARLSLGRFNQKDRKNMSRVSRKQAFSFTNQAY
jgi:hypothetical protein